MPQPLLSGAIDAEYVDAGTSNKELAISIDCLSDRVKELEQRLDQLEAGRAAIKREAVVALLNLLVKSLKHVASGEIDLDEAPVQATTASGKWQAIVERHKGTRIGQVIEMLMLYGPLNQSQIAANLGIDPSNVSKNIMPDLVARGLVEKVNGKVQLRD